MPTPTARRFRLLGGLAAFLILIAAPARALVFSQTSSDIFYFDSAPPAGATPLVCSYFSYDLTNDSGADIHDVWVRIQLDAGCVTLAPNESGDYHAGFMANGQVKHLFFYLHNSCAAETSTPQNYTLTAYSGVPPTAPLQSAPFSFVRTSSTQQTSTNVVNIVFSGPNPPSIGGQISMTVSGTANSTIGSAKILSFSPASYLDWPAQNFIMTGVDITLYGLNNGVYHDRLLLPSSSITDTAGVSYVAVYKFRAAGSTAQAVTVSPIAFISSGTQLKHTDTGGYSGAAFQPINRNSVNFLALSKTVVPGSTASPFGLVYRLRLTNSGSVDSTLDQFIDTPAVFPGSPSYIPGSSSFHGAPIPDPAIAGGKLTWSGTFLVPAGASRDLQYQMELSCSPGSFTNTAIALVGGTQIDTSLDVTDDSPASASVFLSACTPSNTPSFTASPTSTATPSATPTASPTLSATPPGTFTFTLTHTDSPTWTPTFTDSPTPTETGTETGTGTSTVTETGTPTETATDTATDTATESATPSATLTVTETWTESATPTDTASPSPSPTPSSTPTATGTTSATPSASPSLSPSPSSTSTVIVPTPVQEPGRLLSLHPNPVRLGESMHLDFGPGGADADWSVFNVAGELVSSFSLRGQNRQSWAAAVAPGLYFVIVRVRYPDGASETLRLKAMVVR